MNVLDHQVLAQILSHKSGLEFVCKAGQTGDGISWYELSPAGHVPSQTFTVRLEVGWRRLTFRFRPGAFGAELISLMHAAEPVGRNTFLTILDECVQLGAEVDVKVNGVSIKFSEKWIWDDSWRHFEFTISKGMLAINDGNISTDAQLIEEWATRTVAATLALLPVEDNESHSDVLGLPEGALLRVEVNRYERDRRNRAAALAIHGYSCAACGLKMADKYGPNATEIIEVHHTTPISLLGPSYLIDPRADLIPLCPNCHAVAHSREPPFSVKEIQDMLCR